jgi:co-chaperonin GroES (HSP10)
MPKNIIHPVGEMVLIFHDEEPKTLSGILLPSTTPSHVLTGRLIAIPEKMQDDKLEYPFRKLDRVIYDTRHRIPVDLMDNNNRHFLVSYKYIYGIVEKVDDGQFTPDPN